MLKEGLSKPPVDTEPHKALMEPIEKDLLPLYGLRRSGELAPMVALVGFTFVGYKMQFPEEYPLTPDTFVTIPQLTSLLTSFLTTVSRWLGSPHDHAVAEIAKGKDSRASIVSLYVDLAKEASAELYREAEVRQPRHESQ